MDMDDTLIPEPQENEILKKELEIHADRIDSKYQDLEDRKHTKHLVESLDLSLGSKERANRLKSDNKKYWENLKNLAIFINEDFKEVVPLFPGTITLCLGLTGDGKTTLSSNLAHTFLTQNKRVLKIINEERANDCYNRVTCLFKNWHYQQHDEFTEMQHQIFDQFIDVLSTRMNVVDNYSADGREITKVTSSYEGIERILQSALDQQNKDEGYDVIILDYYQNVSESLSGAGLETWMAQERLCKILDTYKNVLKAPIIVLAQKKPGKEEDTGDYKQLIEGRKAIANVATCVLSIKADKENQCTEWLIKKNRWSSALGKTIKTGYHNGKYVMYTNEFRRKVDDLKHDIELGKMMREKQDRVTGDQDEDRTD